VARCGEENLVFKQLKLTGFDDFSKLILVMLIVMGMPESSLMLCSST
jgi:hypothetical protein